MSHFDNLSSIQKYIWIDQLKDVSSPKFNIGGYAKIEADIDLGKFEFSIQSFISSQTIFFWEFQQLDYSFPHVNVRSNNPNKILQVVDLSAELGSDEMAIDWMTKDMQIPFEFTGNLFSTVLLIGSRFSYWYVKFHHIINDGFGLQVFFKEVLNNYVIKDYNNKFCDYKDFVYLQKEQTSSDSKLFWHEKYKTLPDDTFNLKKNLGGSHSKLFSFKIETELFNRARKFCASNSLSILHLFLGSIFLYLRRVYGLNDLSIVIPVRNRSTSNFKKTIGPFLNLLPIDFKYPCNENKLEFLHGIRNQIFTCLKFQDYQLGDLVSDMNLSTEQTNYLTRFRVSYEKHDYDYLIGNQPVEVVPISNFGGEVGLSIHIREYSKNVDKLLVDLDFNSAIFSELEIKSMGNGLEAILEGLIDQSETSIFEINPISDHEKFYQLKISESSRNCETEEFLAAKLGRAIAYNYSKDFLVSNNGILKYEDLNVSSNRIAAVLNQKFQVCSGDIIGIYLKDNSDYLKCLFGVVKSGATYVPLDFSYPDERIIAILNAVSCKFIICDSSSSQKLNQIDDVCTIGIENLNIGNYLFDENRVLNEGPLYLICTSGSTGIPKGAVCTSQSFNNLLNWYIDELSLSSFDKTLIISSLGFDLTQKNIFASALVGATVVMSGDLYDPTSILQTIKEHGITWINCTPSAFYPLIELDSQNDYSNLMSLKYVILGGEPINSKLIADWYNSINCFATLINSYGPTECTDVTNFFVVPKLINLSKFTIPIGKPIRNVVNYIMNSENELVPRGTIGEICIGGIAVGKGYLNDLTMTKMKFVVNPYNPNKVIYLTGDLGRWDINGDIEFCGRVDDQVKIRGHRIELSEIENYLRGMKQIKEVIVKALGDVSADQYLVAYLTSDEDLTVKEIKQYLIRLIPEYMIPSEFVRIEHFPISANGKLDRQVQLGENGKSLSIGISFVEPRSDIEKAVAEIFAKLLSKTEIGIHHSFFDLGGHSLKATFLVNLIHKEFNVKLALNEVFANPTIELLCEIIESKRWTNKAKASSGNHRTILKL